MIRPRNDTMLARARTTEMMASRPEAVSATMRCGMANVMVCGQSEGVTTKALSGSFAPSKHSWKGPHGNQHQRVLIGEVAFHSIDVNRHEFLNRVEKRRASAIAPQWAQSPGGSMP